MSLKAVYVGSQDAHDFMQATIRNYWDWQVVVPTINDFWDALEDGSIDENTSVVVVSTEDYYNALEQNDQVGIDDFLNLVFNLSSGALVILVNYFDDLKNQIDQNLIAYAGQQQEGTLGKYWWIDPNQPMPGIDRAIKEYISSPYSDREAVRQIADAEGYPDPNDTDNRPGGGVLDSITGAVNGWMDGTDDEEEDRYTNNYGARGYLICVTSSKGGAGKTTVSLGMASWLARSSQQAVQDGTLPKPLKICVVDLDVHDSQIGTVIGKYSPTILNLATQPAINQKSLSETVVYADRLKCWFLLAPKLASTADTIPASTFKEAIETLQQMFDVVILDTSVDYVDPLFSNTVYPMSDRLVFVTTLDRRAVAGMCKWIAQVGTPMSKNGSGVDLNKVKIVINRSQKNVEMTLAEIKELIKKGTMMAYKRTDPSIPPDKYHVPKIVGAIPDVPNGQLMRVANMQHFDLSMQIPLFQHPVGELCRNVMPEKFRSKLPFLDAKAKA